ncbi:hypothetical protein AVDCRST_MAG84-2876, partial [uncultured Microcoleus sp.]
TTRPLSVGAQRKNVALPRRRGCTHGRNPTHKPRRPQRSCQKHRQRRADQTHRCGASPRTPRDDRRPLPNGQPATNV